MNPQDHKQALPPGFRLGNYRVVRVLGAGGFGVTYLCEHGGLGVTVAVQGVMTPFQVAEARHRSHELAAVIEARRTPQHILLSFTHLG